MNSITLNRSTQNKEQGTALLITFLFPFFGLIYSLYHWRKYWARNAFWLACCYLGAIQIFHPEGALFGSGADGGRYVLDLQNMHSNVHSFSDVSEYFYDGNTLDVFCSSLQFLVSRFTDNGHVFFLVLAAIYGYFYSRNMWYILERLPSKLGKGVWVLIAMMFLVCPIWLINGVRMWTAAQVFVYGALPFLLEGNKKKLLLCASAILIHHSFIFLIVLVFLYALLPYNLRCNRGFLIGLMVFYVFSLTIKSLDISSVNSVLQSYLPSYYGDRVDIYVNEDYLEGIIEVVEANSWHVEFFNNIQHWVIQLFVFFTFFTVIRGLGQKNTKWIILLFSFSLLIYGIANIMSNVPSGGRFIIVARMFMIPSILLVLTRMPIGKNYRKYLPIMLFLLAFSLLFDIRKGLDYYGIMLFMGNFFTAPFVGSNVPIIEYIKTLL